MEINVNYTNVRQMQAALVAIQLITELLGDEAQRTHAERRRIEYTIKALAHAGLKHAGMPQDTFDWIPF